MGRVAVAGVFLSATLMVIPVAVSPAWADHVDGMTLTVRTGTGPGSVQLDWTGGQPTFRVYRSTQKSLIVDPSTQIGTSDVRTFADAPPAGGAFFYEIASPCVFNPPEICNGLDDDCDGTIDGAGAEASCSLPNATAACSNGACVVASCNGGFGDCDTNPADGCEAPLGVAQSNSPASIWSNDPNPNQDLKPGFLRVAAITNCGGCGVTCDDGIPCTTDLCVPGGGAPVCRHFDRGQCATARCGGEVLPPGTPLPGDPACTAPDSDGDGLSDSWETAQTDPYSGLPDPIGIDIDCDGEISDPDGDFVYPDPPAGPDIKDAYVAYDYMAADSTPGSVESESHQPPQEAIDAVVAAFAARSVVLHVDPVHHELPHADVVYFPGFPPDPCATGDAVSFYDLKAAHFDERRKFTYKYMVFGHDVCVSGGAASDMTGISELKGNDGIVSLGSATYAGTAAQVARLKTSETAGTFMHELGHTFGLDHGGPGDSCTPKPCGSALYTRKPNYISSMNYMLQLGGITRAASPGTIFPFDALAPWRVDYSHVIDTSLDESSLNENDGLGVAPSPYDRDIARYDCPGPIASYAPGYGPIDWNCDQIFGSGIPADIDGDGTHALLPGADDWDNLDYRFQCQPTFADGVVPPGYVASQELSLAAASALGMRARVMCNPGDPLACDDGNACNGAELCSPSTGYCEAGTPPSCDDGNPCTVDTCSVGTGCIHVFAPDGAACGLPNAAGICSGGACVISACNSGFGDCDTNPANGCESSLVDRQSNSPPTLWAGDPHPDQDLQPGFVRVATISNCGTCGHTCDDGNSCTTDVCVQIFGSKTLTATCRHYDRAQCAAARCGGLTLPPGTPAPRDPACTAPDTDGDGLSDAWETPHLNPYTSASQAVGIDLDCDGDISGTDGDFVYDDLPLGPDIKDVYLKVAYMAQSPVPGVDPESHAPAPGVLDAAVAAFGQAGIALHVDPVISEVPHSDFVRFTTSASCGVADSTQFQAIKNGVFDSKKLYTHHFALFGHDVCVDTGATDATGVSEIKGNDFIVALGTFAYAGTTVGVETKKREQAGTLLHELGHNLGLNHYGPATAQQPCDPNCPPEQFQKPNYMSVMNYSHQLFGITRAATPGTIGPPDPTVPWRVDFSHGALNTLDEQSLNETAGLSGASAPYNRDIARIYCPGQGDTLALTFENGAGGIDFDCNGILSPGAIADIDHDGILATLPGADDWHSLDYRFQCQPSFADGPDSSTWVTPQELTAAVAQSRGLRAYVPCQADLGCDDGNLCNGVETCDVTTGLCRPGTPPSCDDGNPCTTDVCSSGTNACIHPSAPDGLPCGGSLFCVLGQTCQSGVCGGGVARDCDDGLACTANACSEAQHACIVTGCTAAPCWSAPLGSGVATLPVSDAALLPAGAPPTTTFLGKGSTLYALRNATDATGTAGSVRWSWTSLGNTLNNFPAPVPMSSGAGVYLYVTTSDGHLYKIGASDGAVAGQADTRRTSCPADQVSASPAVQLYNFSNATFQNEMDSHLGHAHDDLIIVITRNQCGDSTRNRVIAYYASDLTIKWMFNSAGTFKMDYGSDACSVDYANNLVDCGTNLNPGQTSQNSLWAIDSTGVAAQPRWSANAGPIVNRPMLNGGRLYVANADGTVMAYDPAGNAATGGAAPLWTSPVVLSAAVRRAPWVEGRGGTWANRILALDSAGAVHRITDLGTHGARDWSIVPGGTGLQFVASPAVEPTLGKAYLGRSDGMVQQIDLSSGASEALISSGSSNFVFDPSLDLSNGTTATGRLTVATGVATGAVSQFCAPTPYGGCLSDADCTAWSGACVTGACDPLEHVCYARPNLDGSACSDGRACSTGDTCRSGVCEPADVSTCACINAGDAACAPGLTCCGGGVCADLQTDSAHCGSCTNACAADRTCSGGACVAAPAACLAPTAATLSSVASLLGGGDGLAFDRPAGAVGGVCSAYLSTYRYPSASVVSKVDPSGAVQTMTSPSTDSAPLGAIATPREGNQVFATALNRAPGLFPTTQSALIEGAFSPAHLTIARTTLSTSATVPFAAAMYDQGPVGPAFDYQSYTGAGGDSRLYFGNWATNGDVVELRRPCPICSWTQTTVPVSILPAGERITAIAFEQHKSPDPSQFHRSLYIGHGTTLTIVDLDTGSQKNVDLSVTAILGLAVHPVYGDVYVEVKDSSGARNLVDIDEHDLSVRRVRDVQIDLHLQPLVPPSFSNDGRLAITPDFKLLRLVTPVLLGGPPTFTGYQVAR